VLYLCWVDLAVNDHPGTASELSTRRQIHYDWLAVRAQVVHYQRPSLHQIGFNTTGILHVLTTQWCEVFWARC
jgi:hypothetical protein